MKWYILEGENKEESLIGNNFKELASHFLIIIFIFFCMQRDAHFFFFFFFNMVFPFCPCLWSSKSPPSIFPTLHRTHFLFSLSFVTDSSAISLALFLSRTARFLFAFVFWFSC